MISEALDGRRIFVTGATGFVGTALVERLLRTTTADLVLLVRPGRRTSAPQRVAREIWKNDAFSRMRQELGGAKAFDELTARRVQVVPGDVGADGLGLDADGRAALSSCDLVIHSAATVAFDSPLDGAVEVNLLGPVRIVQTLRELGVAPHLVAVSTCYVAGNRRGRAPEALVSEGPFDLGVSWKGEVAAARRVRADAEAESRTPANLARFHKDARRELGAPGTPALAAKTEQLRTKWVEQRMVDAGRARAASLGWPDAYAYTKALGEGALMEERGDVPVSIVRPSIIESALEQPSPGWIRGFRMAEPVIIAYAKGLLKQFPGVPEGVIDVIPVDMVVGAICTVAALGPERAPRITQVASGSVNPLRYRTLIDTGERWFGEHPLYDSKGQPIMVPEFSFPGRGRVEAQLTRARKVIERAERTLQSLPLRGAQAAWSATLEERRTELERAFEYVELYGAYAECEAIYSIDHLLAMWADLDDADRATYAFDPRGIEWERYITEVHLPSIVQQARVKTSPGRSTTEDRSTRLRTAVLAKDRHVAVFDLENTLIASNVVESYAWLATRHLPDDDRVRFAARTLREAPGLLKLDRKDRTDFLRHFYRRYEGAPVERMDADVQELLSRLILTKSFPEGIRRVREHRARGHRTLLITGALSFVVEPLRPLFDEIIAAEMTVRPDGTYSGELLEVPPTGEARSQALFDYCAAEGLDPAECVAYADSTSDLPILEAVGFPVAVNPETRLAALARKRGWLVEHWSKAPGGPRPLLPLAPRPTATTGSRFRP